MGVPFAKGDKTYGSTAVLFASTGLVQQLKVARHDNSLYWFSYIKTTLIYTVIFISSTQPELSDVDSRFSGREQAVSWREFG